MSADNKIIDHYQQIINSYVYCGDLLYFFI